MILNKYFVSSRIINNAVFILKENLFLVIILPVYLIAAFYNIFDAGIVSIDDGYFIAVTHTYSDILRTLLFHPQKLFSSEYLVDLSNNYGGVYTAARPIYILLATIVDTIWTSVYSTRIVSIMAGGLAILFFYKVLGLYGMRKNIAAIFTALFSFSPLFLIYSQIGLSSMLSAAFLLVSLFYTLKFYRDGQTKYLKLSAVFSSFLFMSHYNAIILAAISSLYVFLGIYKNKLGTKNYFSYTFLFLFPIFFWELVTRIGIVLAKSKDFLVLDKDQKIFSYTQEILEQILNRSGAGAVQGFSFSQPFYYLQLLMSFEGLIIFGLTFLGLIIAVKNIKYAKYSIILILVSLFILASSFLAIKTTRQIIVILPLFYLLASLALQQIYDWLSGRINKIAIYFLFVGLIITTIVFNLGTYNFIFNSKTNMPQAVDFVVSSFNPENAVVYSSAASIWRNYLPSFKVESLGDMENDLAREKSEKTILVISDRYTIGKDETGYFENYPQEIIGKFSAIASAGAPDKIKPFFKDEMPSNAEIVIHRILVDTN